MGLETALIASAVGGAALGLYNGQKQQSAMKSASAQAQQNADRQAQQAEQAMNKANAKQPNATLLYDNPTSQTNNTMLSGSAGVDPASLILQRATLLGQ